MPRSSAASGRRTTSAASLPSPKPACPGCPRSLIRIVGTVASAYGWPTCHCSRIRARCSLRTRARALAASNSATGGGTNGENAGSRCATPSMIWPSTSSPRNPACLRTSRSQSLPPLGWVSVTQTSDQFTATLSGHSGSVRSARPLVWTTLVIVVTAVTSARPVIRRASQPSPSRARVPTSTLQCPSWKYVVTSPTQSRLSHGPTRLLIVVDPASGSTRSLSASVAVREPLLEGEQRAGRTATVFPVTSIGASGPVSAPSTRAPSIACGRARLLVEHAGQVGGQGRTGALVVAEDQHPQPLAEVAVLGADDGHDRGGLGLGPGEHPVDRAAAAPDPALGPLVAHRRQRAAYGLDDLLVLGRPGLGEVTLQPVLDEQAPVVGGRLGPVLLGHPGARRQPEQASVVQAEHGAAHLRLLLHQVEPRDGRGHEPGVEPLQERHRPEARRGQLGDQLLEPARLLLQPVVLLRRRCREPGELDVRRQVADLDHGRDARAVERCPEQLVDQQRLVGRERLGGRRRQAEDHRVRELVEQLAQQPAPDLQQVVALVEDEQQRPGRLELLDEGLAVVVQPGEQCRPGGRCARHDLAREKRCLAHRSPGPSSSTSLSGSNTASAW